MAKSDSDRSGNYPTSRNLEDVAMSAGKGVIGAIPWVGSAANELLSLIVPPLERSRVEFFNDLADRLRDVERAVSDEKLAAFVFGAVQSAMASSEIEKRELLRNAVLNVAVGNGGERIDHYRMLIDALTVSHIRVLRFFGMPHGSEKLRATQYVEDAAILISKELPEFRDDSDLVEALMQELCDRRLLPFPRKLPPVLGQGTTDLFTLREARLTNLGQGLLDFVRDPVSAGK